MKDKMRMNLSAMLISSLLDRVIRPHILGAKKSHEGSAPF
jgi:hypothetical protein